MRDATPELIQYLASTNEFCIADLYTFTLKNGIVVRLTSWDTKLTIAGFGVFDCAAGNVNRSRIKQSVGLDVDEVDVTLNADFKHTVAGIPILQALASGWFRGAALTVHRFYMAALVDGKYVTKPGGTAFAPLLWFSGQVGPIEVDPLQVALVAVSDLYVLDVKLPRNVMQPSCRHQIYEAGCDVPKADFAHASTVQTGSTTMIVATDGSGNFATDGYFDQGVFEVTGGANAGLKRTIRKHAAGKLYFHVPLPFAVNAGDGFTAYAGCDKTLATCGTKFNNRANFGGEPFIPVPETIL